VECIVSGKEIQVHRLVREPNQRLNGPEAAVEWNKLTETLPTPHRAAISADHAIAIRAILLR
jgi:hypothetical protein